MTGTKSAHAVVAFYAKIRNTGCQLLAAIFYTAATPSVVNEQMSSERHGSLEKVNGHRKFPIITCRSSSCVVSQDTEAQE